MKAARDSRFCSLTWPGRTDTATSRTSLATSTAMVVDFMRTPPSLSVQRRKATLAHPMPRESREESITSAEADGAREVGGGVAAAHARRRLRAALGAQEPALDDRLLRSYNVRMPELRFAWD